MEREEQVRRFIDDELTTPERRALLQQASTDLQLSTALLRAQELRSELSLMREATTAAATSSDQVQRIMQRALAARDAQDNSPWRWLRMLWLPRYRVSPGGLLLVSLCVAIAVLGAARFRTSRRSADVIASADMTAAVTASVTVDSAVQVPVRFVLPAVGAKSVSLVGDFNAWRAEATQLDDADGDGVFVTTLLLPRGSYGYMFVIDGERWALDPYATNFRDDGFGQRNAVIRVN